MKNRLRKTKRDIYSYLFNRFKKMKTKLKNASSWILAVLVVAFGLGSGFFGVIYDAGAQYTQMFSRQGGSAAVFAPNSVRMSETFVPQQKPKTIKTIAGVFRPDLSPKIKNRIPNVDFNPPKLPTAGFALSRLKSNVLLVETLPLTGLKVDIPAWLRSKYNANSIFADVSANHEYYEPTVDLFRMGVVAGQGNTGQMQLGKTINRAELSKMLAFANEITLMNLPERPFSDVKPDDWFAPFAESLQYHQIFDGYPDGSFRPANTVNFGQMLKLAVLTSGLQPQGQSEIWQKPYYDTALSANLIPEGLKNDDYGKSLTRGEVFAMIQRSISRKDSGARAYREQIELHLPSLGIKNAATYTLPTDPSVWLTDLTQTGLGYYFDTTYDNHIVFGHSSIWPGDPSPAGPVLKDMIIQGEMEAGTMFEMLVDGERKHFRVISKGLIPYEDGQVLLDPNPAVDVLIFTCNTNLAERILIKAEEV